jgi:hypothetical protein
VPLGILSAWEPLGGIFCANLPIIYRAVVNMLRNVKDSVSGQRSQTRNPGSKPYVDSQQSHRRWQTLYNERGRQTGYHSEASATKPLGEVTELQSISMNGIQVRHYFEQEIYHEGDEVPLRPISNETL